MLNKRELIILLFNILTCFFTASASLTGILLPSRELRYAVLAVYLLLLLYLHGPRIKTHYIRYYILAVFMIGCTLYRTAWSPYQCMLFIAAVLLCLLSLNDDKWHKQIAVFLKYIYIFYAAATVFLYFNENFYFQHIIPLFPDTADRLYRWYISGCMAGLTSHYSTNAMLLAVGLLLCCADYIEKRRDKRKTYSVIIHKNIALFLCLFMLAALLLTGKRAHILFAVPAVLFVYYLSMTDKGFQKKTANLIVTIVIILSLAVLVFTTVPALSTFIVRFQETLDSGDVTMGRFELWKLAMESFENTMPFGIGWYQYPEQVSVVFNGIDVYDVHNVYLQLLCETGFPGLFIFLTWFIILLILSIKLFKQSVLQGDQYTSEERIRIGFGLSYQVFFLLYAVTGNPLYDKEMFFPYFISCGIILADYRKSKIGWKA